MHTGRKQGSSKQTKSHVYLYQPHFVKLSRLGQCHAHGVADMSAYHLANYHRLPAVLLTHIMRKFFNSYRRLLAIWLKIVLRYFRTRHGVERLQFAV